MADYPALPTPQLFNLWRTGDALAGQTMAQRFSDWYYAVTTSRLGDANGRAPLQRACVRFQQGILSVATPAELVEWAHGIVTEEVRMAGGRSPGGDFPSALTGGRAPSELVAAVVPGLDAADVKLLSLAYDAEVPIEEVVQFAEAHGGYPLALLQARYRLKRALRDRAGVGFSEVPDRPNLDAGPLPLYEAGRMTNPVEEAGFEKWLLSDMGFCKDLAEFGAFAQALRIGMPRPLPEPVAPPTAAPVEAAPTDAAPRLTGPNRLLLALVVLVVLLVLVAALLGVAWAVVF